MMDYAQQQRNPRKHMIGLTAVVLIHVLVLWAIQSGLAQKTVKVIRKPVEVLLEEYKPPPPPPPPPPPKVVKVVEPTPQAPPPPVYTPPPEVKVDAPPPPIAVTTEPPPAQYKIEPPPPPVVEQKKGPSGLVKGAVCQKKVKPEYPRKALQEGISALLVVHITIAPNGKATDAVVRSSDVADPAMKRLFASAAIAAARQFECEPSETGYIAEQEISFRVTD
jgi:protein TonB